MIVFCRVSYLLTSRPQGMTESAFSDVPLMPGLKQSTLTWTPTVAQYGLHFFVCFAAVDDVG